MGEKEEQSNREMGKEKNQDKSSFFLFLFNLVVDEIVILICVSNFVISKYIHCAIMEKYIHDVKTIIIMIVLSWIYFKRRGKAR